jgi:hypothetical protein
MLAFEQMYTCYRKNGKVAHGHAYIQTFYLTLRANTVELVIIMKTCPIAVLIKADTKNNLNNSSHVLYRVSQKNAMEIQQAVVHHKRS